MVVVSGGDSTTFPFELVRCSCKRTHEGKKNAIREINFQNHSFDEWKKGAREKKLFANKRRQQNYVENLMWFARCTYSCGPWILFLCYANKFILSLCDAQLVFLMQHMTSVANAARHKRFI